jgi:hypothetical protein
MVKKRGRNILYMCHIRSYQRGLQCMATLVMTDAIFKWDELSFALLCGSFYYLRVSLNCNGERLEYESN